MALSQGLHQKLLQKLSPQQIQLMKLLQVPTANLEERIKEELEDNPALEVQEEDHEEEYGQEGQEDIESSEEEYEGSEEAYDDIDINEYMQDGDDEVPDYRTKEDHYPESSDAPVAIYSTSVSFHEYLLQQLGMAKMNEVDRKIAEQIIGSIDDEGYLRREVSALVDDLAFRQNIDCSEQQVEDIIRLIQQFDPPGVAARDLKECLLIQLQRQKAEGKEVDLAISAIEQYFDEFSKKHYDKIQRGLGIDGEGLRDVFRQITRLNPRPGANFSDLNKAESYIVPDFFITNYSGQLELTLNSRNAPDLRISGEFRDMLKDFEKGDKKDRKKKEAVLFMKQKIDAAKWFIEAIKQRQHTLTSVMGMIMEYQREFFLTGDETTLRPMILKDIAERTQLDISTVSRVANSKFVQTEFGTYRLKFFFSESLSTDSGEEVSTREVKKILSDLIADESKRKPLSDERITSLLQEKGYNIARRTVAKYREQLNIPVARLRKQL